MEIKSAEEIYEEHGCSKKSEILDAMKEYAEQSIDLAAEKAEVINPYYQNMTGYNSSKEYPKVNKESILKVKQLIK